MVMSRDRTFEALRDREQESMAAPPQPEVSESVAALDERIVAVDRKVGREFQLLRDDLANLRTAMHDMGRSLRIEMRLWFGVLFLLMITLISLYLMRGGM